MQPHGEDLGGVMEGIKRAEGTLEANRSDPSLCRGDRGKGLTQGHTAGP